MYYMYKLGVSFILKRAPRNTSGGDFIRACKNSEGGVVARGGEHSSIQLPGVLKRSRPPGHCLHCLHKLWLKFGTLLMCSWEGIIHQGLVLSLPLASRVPSISPLWLVKLIGTTVQHDVALPCLTSFYLHLPSKCQCPAASSATFGTFTVRGGTVAVWIFAGFAGIVAGTAGTFVGTCSCAHWGTTEMLYTLSDSIMSWKHIIW